MRVRAQQRGDALALGAVAQVEAHARAAAAGTEGVAQHVLGDVEHPGAEAGPRTVTEAGAVEAEEDFLRQVLGLGPVAELAAEVAEDARRVATRQFREGRLVPVGDTEHQGDFGIAEPAGGLAPADGLVGGGLAG